MDSYGFLRIPKGFLKDPQGFLKDYLRIPKGFLRIPMIIMIPIRFPEDSYGIGKECVGSYGSP